MQSNPYLVTAGALVGFGGEVMKEKSAVARCAFPFAAFLSPYLRTDRRSLSSEGTVSVAYSHRQEFDITEIGRSIKSAVKRLEIRVGPGILGGCADITAAVELQRFTEVLRDKGVATDCVTVPGAGKVLGQVDWVLSGAVPNQVLGVPFACATDPERVLTSAVSGEVTERNLDSWILTVGVPVKSKSGQEFDEKSIVLWPVSATTALDVVTVIAMSTLSKPGAPQNQK
eukprot:gene8566-10985_t